MIVRPAVVLLAAALLGCPAPAGESEPAASPTPSPTPVPPGWIEDVQPLLTRYCGDCHVGAATAGGEVAWLNSLEEVTATAIAPECEGETRAVCIPARIENGEMPFPLGCLPGDLGCITEEELNTVYEWIDAGMPE
jgi:hypothetical protein